PQVCLTCWMPAIPGPTWAAFIQVIASVGGIAVAWHLARSQWRQHVRHEADRDRDAVAAVVVLMNRASQLLKALGDDTKGLPAGPSPAMQHSLEAIAVKLESLD